MHHTALPENGIFVTTATVLPEWLDYNDHMNVAYYVAAFDFGMDAFKATIGMDRGYVARRQRSTVALEAHITYRNEAALGQVLRIETRIIDFDGKRCHLYQEMYRDRDLLATQETLSVSFDLETRRTCPFEAEIATPCTLMHAAQQRLPRPPWIGRRVAIGQGKPRL